MGKFLITMDNSENKNCATLTLDEAYEKFEKNRKARNLANDSIREYYKNYQYLGEFLKYLNENRRYSNYYMRPSL